MTLAISSEVASEAVQRAPAPIFVPGSMLPRNPFPLLMVGDPCLSSCYRMALVLLEEEDCLSLGFGDPDIRYTQEKHSIMWIYHLKPDRVGKRQASGNFLERLLNCL